MARYGVTISPTDYSIQPAESARAVEERGFDSLFVTEHTRIRQLLPMLDNLAELANKVR